MRYKIMLLAVLAVLYITPALAEQEVQLATYQELARIITDAKTGETLTSITLQSKDAEEFTVPKDILVRIGENSGLNSIFVTSKTECIPGIGEQSCLIINVDRHASWTGINAIHEGARDAGDAFVGDANKLFGTSARFHSVYIHSDADAIFGIANPGTITVAYAMPKEHPGLLYERLSGLLAAKIKDGGGFYTAAAKISGHGDSATSFALVREGDAIIMQLVTGRSHTAQVSETTSPLSLLGVNKLERSAYFDDGFYPLNTLVHAIVTNSSSDVTAASPRLLDVEVRNGITIPTSFETAGWVVEQNGNVTDAKYLFGTDERVFASEAWFSFSQKDIKDAAGSRSDKDEFGSEGVLLALGAVSVAIAVALAYVLKKRR